MRTESSLREPGSILIQISAGCISLSAPTSEWIAATLPDCMPRPTGRPSVAEAIVLSSKFSVNLTTSTFTPATIAYALGL